MLFTVLINTLLSTYDSILEIWRHIKWQYYRLKARFCKKEKPTVALRPPFAGTLLEEEEEKQPQEYKDYFTMKQTSEMNFGRHPRLTSL
jgi:hypothetical protein